MSSAPRLRRPLLAVGAGLAAVAGYAAYLVARGAIDETQLGTPVSRLGYNAPIGFVLVLWLFDQRWQEPGRRVHPILAAIVVGAALLRAIVLIPGYSGHALFVTFALFTLRSRWMLVVAAGVAAQVLTLKLAWQDPTWLGGTLLGTALALLHRGRQRRLSTAASSGPSSETRS